jgi:hypothetical protein
MRVNDRRWAYATAAILVIGVLLTTAADTSAQRGGNQVQGPAMENPPIDLTGYWVSVVTEGWRHRMVVPRKGDYESTVMTPAAREIADAWDPEADEAAGEECRYYGAGGVMRIPGRLHITWEDENTLRIDTDAGTQTRLIHFDDSMQPPSENSWQGFSRGEWIRASGGREPGSEPAGRLQVVTDNMRMGYLRRNGVPYSDQTVMTEYLFSFSEPSVAGFPPDEWLVLTAFYDDPLYMNRRFMQSTHYKKEADDSGWNPTPCSAYE